MKPADEDSWPVKPWPGPWWLPWAPWFVAAMCVFAMVWQVAHHQGFTWTLLPAVAVNVWAGVGMRKLWRRAKER